VTLHGQAQAIRELASVLPAQYVRRVPLSAIRRRYRPAHGAAASLTRKAFTSAIACGAAACVIAAPGQRRTGRDRGGLCMRVRQNRGFARG
jgi:hypothetical protein